MHFGFDESPTKWPKIKKERLCTRVTLTQRLVQETSVENLESGLNSKEVRWQLQVRRAATTEIVTGETRTGKPQELSRKKKHQNKGRLVAGGTKMQRLIVWNRNAQADRDLIKVRKREARSEAKKEGERCLANRIK